MKECWNVPDAIAVSPTSSFRVSEIRNKRRRQATRKRFETCLKKKERIRRLEARMNKFWSNHLHSLEQLPELEGDESLEFTWDLETRVGEEKEDFQIVRIGDREIWRELAAFWDNILRFNEIKNLLKQRYGTRFKSLTPTDGSLDYLTGDHFYKLKTLSWT
jgi:hypothetical protein